MDRFETILASNPEITIKEAAAKVGYYDQLHFSKTYKKIRLIPPITYLRSVRSSD